MTKTKTTKPAKETGHQRHLRLKAAGICTACGKRKAQARPASKGGGRYSECRECRAYYSQWAKDKAKNDKK